MIVGLEVANEPKTRRDCSNQITLLSSRGNDWFFDRAFSNYHSNQYTTGDVSEFERDKKILVSLLDAYRQGVEG